MLALKVAVGGQAAKASGRRKFVGPGLRVFCTRTLVFDEIDIGIGGRAAEAVGQKLKALSRTQQVLCVTHLPQIAAFADQPFSDRKELSVGGRSQYRRAAGWNLTPSAWRRLPGCFRGRALTDASRAARSGRCWRPAGSCACTARPTCAAGQHAPLRNDPLSNESEVTSEDVLMADPKKCAHPSCSCTVITEGKYCSQMCEDSMGSTQTLGL